MPVIARKQPSDGWINCQLCAPKRACPRHADEAAAYWARVGEPSPEEQLAGAVDAERARIIAKIRHVAAGHLSPDDPWGAALRQIADILETERGQSETAPASDEIQDGGA